MQTTLSSIWTRNTILISYDHLPLLSKSKKNDDE